MKTIIFHSEKAAPILVERPVPQAGPDEAIIKIHAAALNHRDLNITSPVNKESFIYGSDGAGVIAELGSDVKGWKVGDAVIINSMISCMECDYCINGKHSLCEHGRVLGGTSWDGTFAEYVKVPARNLEKKPEHLTFEQAAALPLAFGTAWRAVVSLANIQAGQTLFIQGIGGGVASYALQIAVAMGVNVIVSSKSDEKIQKALEMGAAAGVNYQNEDVVERLKELAPDGVDVAVASNGSVIGTSIQTVKPGGKIVQFAFIGSILKDFDIDELMGKQITLYGTSMHTYPEFKDALRFMGQHQIIPRVSDTFTMEDYEKAFHCMKVGEQFGKIVLQVIKE